MLTSVRWRRAGGATAARPAVRLDRPVPVGERRNVYKELVSGGVLAYWHHDDWSALDLLNGQVSAPADRAPR